MVTGDPVEMATWAYRRKTQNNGRPGFGGEDSNCVVIDELDQVVKVDTVKWKIRTGFHGAEVGTPYSPPGDICLSS